MAVSFYLWSFSCSVSLLVLPFIHFLGCFCFRRVALCLYRTVDSSYFFFWIWLFHKPDKVSPSPLAHDLYVDRTEFCLHEIEPLQSKGADHFSPHSDAKQGQSAHSSQLCGPVCTWIFSALLVLRINPRTYKGCNSVGGIFVHHA